MKVYREDGVRLLLKKCTNNNLEKGTGQLGAIKIISPMKSNQKVEQFAQRACAISILCGSPNLDGHGHGKPDLPLKSVLPSAGVYLRYLL